MGFGKVKGSFYFTNNASCTVNSEIFARILFYVKFLENKPLWFCETTMSLIDTSKSCLCRKFLTSKICLLTPFAKIKFSRKFSNLQYFDSIYLLCHYNYFPEMYTTDEYKHCGSLLATNEEVGMCTELISNNPQSFSDNTIDILCGYV